MSDTHPARQRLIEYIAQSLASTLVMFLGTSIVTGAVLARAIQLGAVEAGHVVLACLTIAIVFAQYGIWNDDEGQEESRYEVASLGWLGTAIVLLLMMVYLNALVFVAVVIGGAVAPAFGATAVVGYIMIDFLSLQQGWPLSITALFGFSLVIGFKLSEFIDGRSWQELNPAEVLFDMLGRRSNPR